MKDTGFLEQMVAALECPLCGQQDCPICGECGIRHECCDWYERAHAEAIDGLAEVHGEAY